MRDPTPDKSSKGEMMDDLPGVVSMWAVVAGVRLNPEQREEIANTVRGKQDRRAAVIEELRRRNLLPAKKEDWMRW